MVEESALRAAVQVESEAALRTAANALAERMQWMRRAGISFEGERDLYKVLGYNRIITVEDYRDRYARGGLAGRVVDVAPDATWRGSMEIVEDEDPEVDTAFELAWKELDTRLQIQAKFKRVDKLSRLSTYAVLLLGAPGNLEEKLPRGTPEQLITLTPFSGGGGPGGSVGNSSSRAMATGADCTIFAFEVDPHNVRFGLPLSYQLKRVDIASPALARPVHWSRIIHVAENLLDDEVYGQPALERVWNLFDDLDKVTGGGGEAFWLRANQGIHIDIDKKMALPDAKASLEELKEQFELYRHQVTRAMRTRGVSISTLGSDVADFNNPADAIITQIAGAKAIPKRILTGSEMGELASSQDRENWQDQVNGRQSGYAGPYIVRQFIDRCIAYGYLPEPKKGPRAYEVHWPHEQMLTEAEKAEGAKNWATVNATQGSTVFTDEEIRDKWYGMAPLSDAQKAALLKAKEDAAALATQPAQPAAPAAGSFPRAAEEALDEEMLQVLQAAIASNNVDVIDRIIGIGHHEEAPAPAAAMPSITMNVPPAPTQEAPLVIMNMPKLEAPPAVAKSLEYDDEGRLSRIVPDAASGQKPRRLEYNEGGMLIRVSPE